LHIERLNLEVTKLHNDSINHSKQAEIQQERLQIQLQRLEEALSDKDTHISQLNEDLIALNKE